MTPTMKSLEWSSNRSREQVVITYNHPISIAHLACWISTVACGVCSDWNHWDLFFPRNLHSFPGLWKLASRKEVSRRRNLGMFNGRASTSHAWELSLTSSTQYGKVIEWKQEKEQIPFPMLWNSSSKWRTLKSHMKICHIVIQVKSAKEVTSHQL